MLRNRDCYRNFGTRQVGIARYTQQPIFPKSLELGFHMPSFGARIHRCDYLFAGASILGSAAGQLHDGKARKPPVQIVSKDDSAPSAPHSAQVPRADRSIESGLPAGSRLTSLSDGISQRKVHWSLIEDECAR
jgi:hypothetical protein